MNGKMLKRIVLFASIGLFTTERRGYSDEVANPPKETGVVLRVSREFIRQHAPPTVDEERPVNECRFGARVTGNSVTAGRTWVTMEAREREAVFTLHFRATTVSKTIATKRPVQVYSTSTTESDVRREIRFDGVRFFEIDDPKIDATTSSQTDGIGTPPGIRGRIAYRMASAQTEKLHSQNDELTLEETKAAVLKSYTRASDQFVKQLNGVVPFEKTIALLFPKSQGWITHLSTTPEYLVISPGPKEANIAVLPKQFLRMKAPVELWIRGKEDGDRARKALETWTAVNNGLNRFRAEVSGKEAKAEGLKLTAVGEWWVVNVGADLAEKWMDGLEKKSPQKEGTKTDLPPIKKP